MLRAACAGDLEALDVLLRRRRVGRLGEDEDLFLDGRLELGEALVDRARSRSTSMYSSGSRVGAAGLEARAARLVDDDVAGVALQRRQLGAAARERRSTARLRGDAAYLTTVPGRADARPFWTRLARTS